MTRAVSKTEEPSTANVSIAYRTDERAVGKIAQLDKQGKISTKVGTNRAHPDRLRTVHVGTSDDLARVVRSLRPHEHLLFGVPRETAKADADGIYEVGYRASMRPNQIALTKGEGGDIVWPSGPGVLYLDIDVKDPVDQPLFPDAIRKLASSDIADRLRSYLSHQRELPGYACWPGSSANLSAPSGDTTGSGSLHLGVLVKDATDVERAGAVLHMRSILHGDGWAYVSASGGVEVRSLFDNKVWSPNRAIYAGGAKCFDGITQKREVDAFGGSVLETRVALQDLSKSELAQLKAMEQSVRDQAQGLAKERRQQWLERRVATYAGAKAGHMNCAVTPELLTQSRRELERSLDHRELGPELEIFGMLRGKKRTVTVRQLMAEPSTYDGMTCTDPLDCDYDGGRRTVAKFFANPGGTPAIHDLHTSTVFVLRQSAADEFDSEDSSHSSGGENIVSFGRFVGEREPLVYVVQNVLARNYVYALTAPWGAGKTAVAVTLAIAVASGRNDIIDFPVDQCRVLYLSGENPGDVSLRAEQTAKHFGVDQALLDKNLCFTLRPFPINDGKVRADFVKEALRHGEFGLVIIDTSSAHSHIDDENGNAEMHRLAQSFRQLGQDLGDGPAVLVLCHPAKNAKTKDEMQPRGGGAFSGTIDGELALVLKDNGLLELSPRMKFRGPGFDSAYFRLDRQTVEGELDNFLSSVKTVVAVRADPLDESVAAIYEVPLSANASAALVAVHHADVLHGNDTGFPRYEAFAVYDRGQGNVAKGGAPTVSARNKARERAFSELVKRGSIQIHGKGRDARVLVL